MALNTLTFAPPVRKRPADTALNYELLEQAVAMYDEGKHAQSLQAVFAHLFPSHPAPQFDKAPFTFAQGSSKVIVKTDAEFIEVSVPLVKLPAGGTAVAALRFLLTKISGSGQLHQPRLRGDDVYLEFRDRLDRLHPYKLVEVLRRIPVEADNNDDWLIGQFAASPLDRQPIAELTPDEVASAEAIWQSHWNDVDELVKESQRKRSVFFLNELTAYAFYRVRFALPLTGYLYAKIAEHARVFNNGEEDPTKRENSLVKCVKEMKAVTTAELRKDLGHPTFAISPNAEGTPAVINNYFAGGNYAEQIEQYRSTGKSMEAALALVSTYTFLLGRYSWTPEIETDLMAGLAAASGKSWREIAAVLTAHGKEMAERYGDDDDDDSDGSQAGADGDGSSSASGENQGDN